MIKVKKIVFFFAQSSDQQFKYIIQERNPKYIVKYNK